MRALGSIVCVLAVMAAGAVKAQEASPDRAALFDSLDQMVRSQYYDPHFNGRDWPAISARYRGRLGEVRSDAEFQRLGQGMLNELGVSHVVLHAPGQGGSGMGLGARLERLQGAMVVVDIDPASAARGAGLRVGDRILNPERIAGPPDEPARLDVEHCDGRRASLSAPRETAYWPPRERTMSWSSIRRGDGRSVGYLRADRFNDDGVELIDAAMAALSETDGLIIDVRQNSGGNASALRLVSYFADAGPGVVLLSRSFLEALDGPLEAADLADVHRAPRAYTTEAVFQAVTEGQGAVILMTEDLGDTRYRNPVVVLIGPETGSAAEGFAWGMRRGSDAVLIGRESAGALLSSERFDLIDGWAVTLPVHGIWGADGEDFGDRAVPPHVETTWTRDAVCRGEDPDLETAIRTLEKTWAERSA